ncbi:MAG: IS1 family transposase [Raineya sp.]|nr:IS1 family transposase [Raineya sp.]
MDELGSYVGQKRWIVYAYAPETNEILAYVIGKRNAATVRKLYQKLKNLQIDTYCTDEWEAFKQVFSKENHQVGKAYTRQIESVNTCLRARNRRLVRKTTGFSKKEPYQDASVKIMFYHRNYCYHTF